MLVILSYPMCAHWLLSKALHSQVLCVDFSRWNCLLDGNIHHFLKTKISALPLHCINVTFPACDAADPWSEELIRGGGGLAMNTYMSFVIAIITE